MKNKLNPKVDDYLVAGCGRCKYFATPKCKVNDWRKELEKLRAIILNTELVEEIKWSFPCYTYQNKNVIMLSAFKEYSAINFFKGVLLKNEKKLLIQQTENMQSTRQLRFTSLKEINDLELVIKSYLNETIEIEKSGAKINLKKTAQFKIPIELQNKFNKNDLFKSSFYALTPGRQRGYLLYFSQPKQSKTIEARIEKFTKHILNGKGFHD